MIGDRVGGSTAAGVIMVSPSTSYLAECESASSSMYTRNAHTQTP